MTGARKSADVPIPFVLHGHPAPELQREAHLDDAHSHRVLPVRDVTQKRERAIRQEASHVARIRGPF